MFPLVPVSFNKELRVNKTSEKRKPTRKWMFD